MSGRRVRCIVGNRLNRNESSPPNRRRKTWLTFLKIDAHLHLYPTKAIGAFEKGGLRHLGGYGEKPGVKFSEYDGDLADTLEAMEAAGVHKAIVVNLFSTRGVMERAVARMPGRMTASEREGSDQGG